MPTRVGIREAKAHLSRYLRMVKGGREIILTERGRPIGKIVPLDRGELTLAERIERLQASGLIGPPKGAARVLRPLEVHGKSAQEYLQEDRKG